jgi:cytochrome c peroxidase
MIRNAFQCGLALWLGLTFLSTSQVSAQRFGPKVGDMSLRSLIAESGVRPIDPPFEARMRWASVSAESLENQYRLGRALYYDPVLSGNLDVSCATCHHPLFSTTDNLSLPIGVGGKGLGTGFLGIPHRSLGVATEWIPRNSPEIYNRQQPEWTTSFWDGRVELGPEGFRSPAGDKLPGGLTNQLAVQALFPITSRDEMRGHLGDSELGNIPDQDLVQIWERVMNRLLSIPGYRDMFQKAFPLQSGQRHSIVDYANAIALYEEVAFTLDDSPFNSFLRGDDNAMSEVQKRGATLFFGKANCVSCHSGTLLTDQQYHNLAVPQFGPGKVPLVGVDVGRMLVTGALEDRFKFRTPSLHNVAETGPWMHNGAFASLEDAIRHHIDPIVSLRQYEGTHLPHELQSTIQDGLGFQASLIENAWLPDPEAAALTEGEINDLVDFLQALTSRALLDGELLRPKVVPSEVPSGLPLDIGSGFRIWKMVKKKRS